MLVLKNYLRHWQRIFNISGRASRSEFWSTILIKFILFGICILIDSIDLFIFIYVIHLIPSLTLQFRRFHDHEKSAWNYLWVIVPFGILYLLMVNIGVGDFGENKYGQEPDLKIADS